MCRPSLSMALRSDGASDAGSGGTIAENRFHRHRHVVHQPAEDHRRFGVARRMSHQLATRFVRVAPASEIVAVVERRHGALERQDLQPVARQIRDRE